MVYCMRSQIGMAEARTGVGYLKNYDKSEDTIMASVKGTIGTILTLGGLTAAAYAVYKNKDLLMSFAQELLTPPQEAAPEEEPAVEDFEVPAPVEEKDIVIDRTAEA